MKGLLIGSVVAGLLVGSIAMAEEAAPAAAPADQAAAPVQKVKKEAKPLQDITLAGKITVEEKIVKNKKTGEDVKKTGFVLTTADGLQVILPQGNPKKNGVMLDGYVNKDVKVVGKGMDTTNKKNVRKVTIKTITSIEEVAAAPSAAPAAK